LKISLLSTNLADVGTYNLGLVATLASYTANTFTFPFTVTISPCVVTSVSVVSGAFDAALTSPVNVYDTVGHSIPIPTFA
jgi:hypothetical protein